MSGTPLGRSASQDPSHIRRRGGEVPRAQRPDPRVEDLQRLRSGLNLGLQIDDDRLGQLVQQAMGFFGGRRTAGACSG